MQWCSEDVCSEHFELRLIGIVQKIDAESKYEAACGQTFANHAVNNTSMLTTLSFTVQWCCTLWSSVFLWMAEKLNFKFHVTPVSTFGRRTSSFRTVDDRREEKRPLLSLYMHNEVVGASHRLCRDKI